MHDDLGSPSGELARTLTRRIVAAMLGLTIGLALLAVAQPAEAKASGPTCVPSSSATSWRSALTSASAALDRARTDIKKAHYGKATNDLRTMRRNTRIAHTAATALIGRPPTDPESDDPPGVGAVLKVGAFEHRLSMALVPLFSDPHAHHVGRPLARGLTVADSCRQAMLAKVIALKPGKRDDYVDGLSDTLPTFKQELTAISTQLGGHGLTRGGRSALTRVRGVVTETQVAMKKVFGGGE